MKTLNSWSFVSGPLWETWLEVSHDKALHHSTSSTCPFSALPWAVFSFCACSPVVLCSRFAWFAGWFCHSCIEPCAATRAVKSFGRFASLGFAGKSSMPPFFQK
eukprot:420108-Amphidinium_carterae.1